MNKILNSLGKVAMLCAAVAAAAVAAAGPVTPQRAIGVAERYLKGQALTCRQMGQLYVVTPEEGSGFVVVAADDCVRPVLAYSRVAKFDVDSMPAHVADWLMGYSEEIASWVAAGIQPSSRVVAEWQQVPVKSGGGLRPVAPLLTTRWNQRPLYNLLCPYFESDSAHAVTGCTATATAQIMKYWGHPVQGHGSHYYYWDGVRLSANFDTIYPWSSMPDELTPASTSEEIEVVAMLMYHVGVAVEMQYGLNASGARVLSDRYASSQGALKAYFGYSPTLYAASKALYTDEEWDGLLRSELERGRPVLYTGYDPAGGHAFVVDGCDSSNLFHINWGWGGHYDGYYALDSLSPGAGGAGGNATYTFNENNAALVGICPIERGSERVTISAVPSDSLLGTTTGSGLYAPYSMPVTLRAEAAAGARFAGWASGHCTNPFSFTPNGNLTDTALFLPLWGDTLCYVPGPYLTSWADDYGDVTEWGIRLPASSRPTERSLAKVQLFVRETGEYVLNIYQGDQIAPSTLRHTSTHSLDGNYRWATLRLDTAVVLDNRRPLWVTFRFTGTGVYPATMAYYSGNPDGIWYHLPSGWEPYDQQNVCYTWMIRALLEERECRVSLTVNDSALGTALGAGNYPRGTTLRLEAYPAAQAEFAGWSNGVTDNPYELTVQSDTLLTALFRPLPAGIDPAGEESATLIVEGTTLVATTPSPEALQVYDAAGRLVGSLPAACTHRFEVPSAGLYLVRLGGRPVRRIVAVNNNQ